MDDVAAAVAAAAAAFLASRTAGLPRTVPSCANRPIIQCSPDKTVEKRCSNCEPASAIFEMIMAALFP